MTYVNNPEDFSNRGALLGELAIDRCVTALDALAHAQKLTVVAYAGDLQVHLPSAHIDYFLQLIIGTSSQHTNSTQKHRRGEGTYVKERDQFGQSLVARFDSQRIGL